MGKKNNWIIEVDKAWLERERHNFSADKLKKAMDAFLPKEQQDGLKLVYYDKYSELYNPKYSNEDEEFKNGQLLWRLILVLCRFEWFLENRNYQIYLQHNSESFSINPFQVFKMLEKHNTNPDELISEASVRVLVRLSRTFKFDTYKSDDAKIAAFWEAAKIAFCYALHNTFEAWKRDRTRYNTIIESMKVGQNLKKYKKKDSTAIKVSDVDNAADDAEYGTENPLHVELKVGDPRHYSTQACDTQSHTFFLLELSNGQKIEGSLADWEVLLPEAIEASLTGIQKSVALIWLEAEREGQSDSKVLKKYVLDNVNITASYYDVIKKRIIEKLNAYFENVVSQNTKKEMN